MMHKLINQPLFPLPQYKHSKSTKVTINIMSDKSMREQIGYTDGKKLSNLVDTLVSLSLLFA